MARRIQLSVILAFLAFAAAGRPASACPLCKESIANTESDGSGGPAAGGIPSGFNDSIYVMLAAFVGVLSFVGFTLYRGAK